MTVGNATLKPGAASNFILSTLIEVQCLTIQAMLPITFTLGSLFFYLSLFNIAYSPMQEHCIMMVLNRMRILYYWIFFLRQLQLCPQCRHWYWYFSSSRIEFVCCYWSEVVLNNSELSPEDQIGRQSQFAKQLRLSPRFGSEASVLLVYFGHSEVNENVFIMRNISANR